MTRPADDSKQQPAGGPGGWGTGRFESRQETTERESRSAASAWGLSFVDLTAVEIPDEVRALVPREVAEAHGVIPFARHGNRLWVAASDPLDVERIDRLQYQLGLEVEIRLAPAEQIARAIGRSYGPQRGAQQPGGAPGLDAVSEKGRSDGSTRDENAAVIQLVQDVITDAVRRRASDIHLEPLERRFRVRVRIDGVLVELPDLPKRVQLPVISRLKIMANISIAERRLPQDGRIQFRREGRPLDLRASTLPTVHGESMVLRVLDREDLRPGLGELGLMDDDRATLERMIGLPNGLILATGPTGSGKTTTLYGCLQQLNQADRKIITVEDPVEYQLNGINQVSVRHDTGMTFASALRAMLRQAPNIVMVGEIRDRETAEIALHASLTGHLVFSTLHTNDAPGAVTRLNDIGVKPFLLAGSLRAVLAQRLVRKNCRQCRRAVSPTTAELVQLGPRGPAGDRGSFMRGMGCAACGGTGYHGRIGLFELLVLDDEISQMIHERPGSTRLRERARALGMRTLREDGARKASAGLTTIEEVVSMTAGDAS